MGGPHVAMSIIRNRNVEFKKGPCRMSLRPEKGLCPRVDFRGLHPLHWPITIMF